MRTLSYIRWSIVAALLALLIAPAAVALTTGTQLVVVDGKSMTPTYDYGDIVLIGPPTEAYFAPDHVVTVGLPNGAMYTHRIVSITDGRAQLKGDGNVAEDPETITYNQIVGAVRGHIGSPLADILAYAQSLPARVSLAVLVLALILLPLTRQPRANAGKDNESAFPAPSPAQAELPVRESLPDSLATLFGSENTDVSPAHAPPAPQARRSSQNLQQG